jgi:hypothetical protein
MNHHGTHFCIVTYNVYSTVPLNLPPNIHRAHTKLHVVTQRLLCYSFKLYFIHKVNGQQAKPISALSLKIPVTRIMGRVHKRLCDLMVPVMTFNSCWVYLYNRTNTLHNIIHIYEWDLAQLKKPVLLRVLNHVISSIIYRYGNMVFFSR